jgi:hypothetical protein
MSCVTAVENRTFTFIFAQQPFYTQTLLQVRAYLSELGLGLADEFADNLRSVNHKEFGERLARDRTCDERLARARSATRVAGKKA